MSICRVLDVFMSLLCVFCVLKWLRVLVIGSLFEVVRILMIFCGKLRGVLMLVLMVVLLSGIFVIWGSVVFMCLIVRWICCVYLLNFWFRVMGVVFIRWV